jgi:hypothetical protein
MKRKDWENLLSRGEKEISCKYHPHVSLLRKISIHDAQEEKEEEESSARETIIYGKIFVLFKLPGNLSRSVYMSR